ncbi:hypothetical protein FA95DRAFT_1603194 [Auriscalpium vulgare]|uniref:Uncharacterized protein n=1 Tax=Auriscalpium vulgare TaxID=40419 RepID=A0ACB8S4W4_9AGAM|nr:hypothetical protein FA95DRAFT_1603194 [Auriscalpium vulgare]
MILQTLSAVTPHGGLYVRIEIAEKISAILQLLDEEPNDSYNPKSVVQVSLVLSL